MLAVNEVYKRAEEPSFNGLHRRLGAGYRPPLKRSRSRPAVCKKSGISRLNKRYADEIRKL